MVDDERQSAQTNARFRSEIESDVGLLLPQASAPNHHPNRTRKHIIFASNEDLWPGRIEEEGCMGVIIQQGRMHLRCQ